jgi:hypothetical protein
MEEISNEKICSIHKSPYQYLCLDEECKENFLLCQACKESNVHKHSKTSFEHIK